MPALRPLAAVLLLTACGGRGDGGGTSVLRPVAPATRAMLAAKADPTTWEDLDPTHPGSRLRDPRTGLVFRKVPRGKFTMGGTADPGESPPHEVELTRDYLLAETEVTVAQWQRWLDEHGGAASAPPAKEPPQHPRTRVLGDEAAAFCATYGYRLPTEAEWERACRGGLGDADGPWRSQRELVDHAWFHRNAKDGAKPVATRTANPFGLHDLLGNVWEYCSDRFAPYGDASARIDPTGPAEGTGGGRVLRGGSWFTTPGPTPSMRSAEPADPAAARNAFTGFRPAR